MDVLKDSYELGPYSGGLRSRHGFDGSKPIHFDPFRGGLGDDEDFEDSDEGNSAYEESAIAYAAGPVQPPIYPTPATAGVWYGQHHEKLSINRQFEAIIRECEDYYKARPGFDGTADQTKRLRTFIQRALDAINMGQHLLACTAPIAQDEPAPRYVSATWTDLPYEQAGIGKEGKDKPSFNNVRSKMGGGIVPVRGGAPDSSAFGSLRGGATPTPSDAAFSSRRSRNLKRRFDLQWTRPRQTWGGAQVNSTLDKSDLPDKLDDLQTKGPLMYPSSDLDEAVRARLSNRLKAVIATNSAQYESAKTVTDANLIRSTILSFERVVDLGRVNGEAFLKDFVSKQVSGRSRFQFVNPTSGTERFIGALADAFNVTIGHIIIVFLYNKLLELENDGIAELIQAEIEFLQSLRRQEELWGEFDLFQISWMPIGENDRDVVARRVRLRRELDGYWAALIAQFNQALVKFNDQGWAAFPEQNYTHKHAIGGLTPPLTSPLGEDIRPQPGDDSGPDSGEDAINQPGGVLPEEPTDPDDISESDVFPPKTTTTPLSGTSSREGIKKSVDVLSRLRSGYTLSLQEYIDANDELDGGDPGDAPRITANNQQIMSYNKLIWDLDTEIANLRGRKPMKSLGASTKNVISAPLPAWELYKYTKRFEGQKDLPGDIRSLAPGNLPGDHPAPGIPRVVVGAPIDFGQYSSTPAITHSIPAVTPKTLPPVPNPVQPPVQPLVRPNTVPQSKTLPPTYQTPGTKGQSKALYDRRAGYPAVDLVTEVSGGESPDPPVSPPYRRSRYNPIVRNLFPNKPGQTVVDLTTEEATPLHGRSDPDSKRLIHSRRNPFRGPRTNTFETAPPSQAGRSDQLHDWSWNDLPNMTFEQYLQTLPPALRADKANARVHYDIIQSSVAAADAAHNQPFERPKELEELYKEQYGYQPPQPPQPPQPRGIGRLREWTMSDIANMTFQDYYNSLSAIRKPDEITAIKEFNSIRSSIDNIAKAFYPPAAPKETSASAASARTTPWSRTTKSPKRSYAEIPASKGTTISGGVTKKQKKSRSGSSKLSQHPSHWDWSDWAELVDNRYDQYLQKLNDSERTSHVLSERQFYRLRREALKSMLTSGHVNDADQADTGVIAQSGLFNEYFRKRLERTAQGENAAPVPSVIPPKQPMFPQQYGTPYGPTTTTNTGISTPDLPARSVRRFIPSQNQSGVDRSTGPGPFRRSTVISPASASSPVQAKTNPTTPVPLTLPTKTPNSAPAVIPRHTPRPAPRPTPRPRPSPAPAPITKTTTPAPAPAPAPVSKTVPDGTHQARSIFSRKRKVRDYLEPEPADAAGAPDPDEVVPDGDGWPDLKYLMRAYRTAELARRALGQRRDGTRPRADLRIRGVSSPVRTAGGVWKL
ncbi:hypothetical protein F4811DRAFT_541917 [Daldinia bambusicola]|nr:hypothetical protein F4811DRAFT_541917 [Daldinia bambusicola]